MAEAPLYSTVDRGTSVQHYEEAQPRCQPRNLVTVQKRRRGGGLTCYLATLRRCRGVAVRNDTFGGFNRGGVVTSRTPQSPELAADILNLYHALSRLGTAQGRGGGASLSGVDERCSSS